MVARVVDESYHGPHHATGSSDVRSGGTRLSDYRAERRDGPHGRARSRTAWPRAAPERVTLEGRQGDNPEGATDCGDRAGDPAVTPSGRYVTSQGSDAARRRRGGTGISRL